MGAAVVVVVGAAELLDVGVGPVAEPLLEHPDSATTATEATAAATVNERTKATTKTSPGDDTFQSGYRTEVHDTSNRLIGR